MMDINERRRGLFSSLTNFLKDEPKKIEEIIIRPPYWDEIGSFDKKCLSCEGYCATFCEESIIFIDSKNKTPHLDFKKSGCTFCDACANSCPNGVLKKEYKKNIQVSIQIDILKCLSWNDTMCFSCKEPCLKDAIKFLGIFRPSIDENLCTSCGFCIALCPNDAIKIKEKKDV